MSLKTTVDNYKKAKAIYKAVDDQWYDMEQKGENITEFDINQLLNRLKDLKRHIRYVEIADLEGAHSQETIDAVKHNTELMQDALYFWERSFSGQKLASDLQDAVFQKYLPDANVPEKDLDTFGGNMKELGKRFIAAITHRDNVKEYERAIKRMNLGTMSQREFDKIYAVLKHKMIPAKKHKFQSRDDYKKENG